MHRRTGGKAHRS